MPKRVNPKCLHCSQLSPDEAKNLHDSSGDGCWDDRLCHGRRSRYRHRADRNAAQRQRYQRRRPSTVEVQEVPPLEGVTPRPVVYLYVYRENPENKDSPTHSVAATVWTGEEKLAVVAPIHVHGMGETAVEAYIKKVMAQLKRQFPRILGNKFEHVYELPSAQCPADNCPLKQVGL